MNEKMPQKDGKTEYADANETAHTMSKDPGVKLQHVSGGGKTRDQPVVEHDMDSDVTTSMNQMKLTCPRCGESTVRAEIPDKYETWIKCSSCHFFMGMSNSDWHRMKNSPNINEKIKKMAIKKELLKE
jgi:predicted RNA-binding Zn-ribbon protein involved in translation (DUF1610 family)